MNTLKNIFLFVADSLRRDTCSQTLVPMLDQAKVPYVNYGVTSENSCTELSLPWMLSGIEVFSPNMSMVSDLKRIGYKTTLIHSNPIVDRFKAPFSITINISNSKPRMRKKYNRVRQTVETHLPWLYHRIKSHFQYPPNNYLPYARIYDVLPYIEFDPPQFMWIHLMDTHTPYYPVESKHSFSEIVDTNNHQISAVRGYYKPSWEEVQLWRELYLAETVEMSCALVDFLRRVDYDESVVVFTSDHGEEFGEHGEYGHKGNRFNSENVEVPFLVIGNEQPLMKIRSHKELRRGLWRLIK